MPLRARARAVSIALACSAWVVHGCIEAPSSPGEPEPTPAPTPEARKAPSHGFNDAIAWRHLDEGLAEAAKRRRPVMLLVHAAWCRSCRALEAAFASSRLVELSHELVMINLDQDREPRSQEFALDGDYVPRIVFLEPTTGRPDPSIHNPRRESRRYYYSPRDDLLGAMKEALSRHGET
jgi:protein-disulfide reductase (glutathione)